MRPIHFFSGNFFILGIFFVNVGAAAVIPSLDNIEESGVESYANNDELPLDEAQNYPLEDSKESGVGELSRRYESQLNINKGSDRAVINEFVIADEPDQRMEQLQPMTELYQLDQEMFSLPKRARKGINKGLVMINKRRNKILKKPKVHIKKALKKVKSVVHKSIVHHSKIKSTVWKLIYGLTKKIIYLVIEKIRRKWKFAFNFIYHLGRAVGIPCPRQIIRNILAKKGKQITKTAQKYLDDIMKN